MNSQSDVEAIYLLSNYGFPNTEGGYQSLETFPKKFPFSILAEPVTSNCFSAFWGD